MPYRPRGLLAEPPPLPEPPERPGTPGLLAMDATPPTPLVLRPRGFLFVVDRLPGAPVMSLRELPYSRTMSPQVRDELAILQCVSQASSVDEAFDIPRSSAPSCSSHTTACRRHDCTSSIADTSRGSADSTSDA
jgi:hypothetical protein